MSRITIGELRARHAELTEARMTAQREAREQDLGFAYALGEVERLIALAEQHRTTKGEQTDDSTSKE